MLVTSIDVATIRDQLWAEAFARVERGEEWHFPHRLEKAQRTASEIYTPGDPLAERLGVWVAGIGRAFTTEEAIGYGLGIPVERIDKSLTTSIGSMLHRLGCTKFRARRGTAGRPCLWESAQARSESA
jgi:hypothetical protein